MAKTKVKEYKQSDEIYFQCLQDDCGKIVFKPMGALTHANKTHGLKLKMKDVGNHFLEVSDPPQAVIDEIRAKRERQAHYVARQRKPKSTSEGDEIHYECKGCGLVVRKRNSLYGHCGKIHKKPLSKVGYKETTKPITNPTRGAKKNTPATPPSGLTASLMEHMPQVVDIPGAEPIEDGIILTVRFKITVPYFASVILPTLTS